MLSGGAVARITGSKLKELVITDSIQPTEAVKVAHNIRVISIAQLMGEAIGRTATEKLGVEPVRLTRRPDRCPVLPWMSVSAHPAGGPAFCYKPPRARSTPLEARAR